MIPCLFDLEMLLVYCTCLQQWLFPRKLLSSGEICQEDGVSHSYSLCLLNSTIQLSRDMKLLRSDSGYLGYLLLCELGQVTKVTFKVCNQSTDLF